MVEHQNSGRPYTSGADPGVGANRVLRYRSFYTHLDSVDWLSSVIQQMWIHIFVFNKSLEFNEYNIELQQYILKRFFRNHLKSRSKVVELFLGIQCVFITIFSLSTLCMCSEESIFICHPCVQFSGYGQNFLYIHLHHGDEAKSDHFFTWVYFNYLRDLDKNGYQHKSKSRQKQSFSG